MLREIFHVVNILFHVICSYLFPLCSRCVDDFAVANPSSLYYDVIIIICDVRIMEPEVIGGKKTVGIPYDVEWFVDQSNRFVVIHCMTSSNIYMHYITMTS